MSKRLYSEVLSGSSSEEDFEITKTSKPVSIVNWLNEYQIDEEDVALEKALGLSKVSFVSFSLYVSIKSCLRQEHSVSVNTTFTASGLS